MNSPHVIKKMSNRRLYDTRTAQHVTLKDLACFIKNHEEVLIVDARKRDITTSVLLQIVASLENLEDLDVPILSTRFLTQVIQSPPDAMPTLLTTFLEQSMRRLADGPTQMGGTDAAHLSREYFDQWQSVRSAVICRIFRRASDDLAQHRKKIADRG